MPELSFAAIAFTSNRSPKLMQTQGLEGHTGPSTNDYPSRGVIILNRVVFSKKRGAAVTDSGRIGLALRSRSDRRCQLAVGLRP